MIRCDMTQRVRPAIQADLAAIQEIVRVAYSDYIPRIGRAPGPMLDDYATLINHGWVHVVERDCVVQGILVLIPQDDAMLLDNVAVTPPARGSGLGRLMIDTSRCGRFAPTHERRSGPSCSAATTTRLWRAGHRGIPRASHAWPAFPTPSCGGTRQPRREP